jgi:glycine cleavage system aminomethyltransferase T
MPHLDAEQHRIAWEQATGGGRSLYLERPAVFSPAAAAQDAANSSRMLWNWAPIWLPWEYTDWLVEGRSFHDTAYIGDWSGLVKIRFVGPDALAFFNHIGTADLANFAPGRVKHHVQVDENGFVAGQGVLYRVSEEEFWFTGGSAFWSYFALQQGSWDVEAFIDSSEHFLFSVQGPKALTIMEEVVGATLSHLRFNEWEEYPIGQWPVRVLRTGITGEIGYELHGPSAGGNDVWSKVVEIGESHGIKQLGVRAQMISHVEAGIATNDRDFVSAAVGTAGRPQITPSARSKILGSFAPASMSELYRTPAELNWKTQVQLEGHDFVGRDALIAQRDAGGPARRLTGLTWNSDDIKAVYSTLFDEGDIVTPMDLPRNLVLAVDRVLHRGREVGVSTSRVYSPFYKRMISLAHLDIELIEPGTEVTVIWGQAGGPQREVRATVTQLPFKRDIRRSTIVEKESALP